MLENRKIFRIIILIFLFVLIGQDTVWGQVSDEEYYVNKLLEEIEFDETIDFLEEELGEKIDFEDMLNSIIKNGLNKDSMENVKEYFSDCFLFELEAEKVIFKNILFMGILFTLFNKVMVSKGQYLSEISFLMVYTSMMVLLMNNFIIIGETVTRGLERILCFFGIIIPVFSTTLLISGNLESAGMFYVISFVVIYIIEWGMKIIIMPGIHIYVFLLFLDNIFSENKLSKMANVLRDFINFLLKSSIGIVLGIGIVQSMIAPVKDRLSGNMILKSFSAIPGLGNAAGVTGEILLSCGMLIKNSVGVVMLIFLILLAFAPVVKVFICKWLYQLLASIMQPVADRRIVNAIHAMAEGGKLYFKLLVNSVLLFFILLSIVCTSTTYVN